MAIGGLALALLGAGRGRTVMGVAAGRGLTLVQAGVRRGRTLAHGAVERFRTSSSPSAGLYEALAERFLAGYYDTIATEAATALDEVGGRRVLEVGPGPGGVCVRLAALSRDARVTALDIDPAMIARLARRARREGLTGRLQAIVGDVAAMPFDDAAFDLVLSSFSVHHWAAAGEGFAEIRRVLRPGGRVIAYDLPDAWGRLETGAPGIAAAALAGGFRDPRRSRVRWPGRFEVIVRLVAEREA